MKLSIVIPAYNSEKYLESCVNSIVNQGYDNLEVILVNDGSTDSTPLICDSLSKKDCRIKVIHKKNTGVSQTRNIGMDAATGDYIIFIDSDDTIQHNFLKDIIPILKNKPIDILSFGVNIIQNDVVTTKWEIDDFVCEELSDLNGIMSKYIKELFASCWNKIYNLILLKSNNVRFEEDIALSEDVVFNIEAFLVSKNIIHIKECYYNYFLHPNLSLSRRGNATVIKECERRLVGFEKLFEKIGYQKAEIDNLMYEELQRAVINQFMQAYTNTTILTYKEKVEIIKNICNNSVHKKMLSEFLKDDARNFSGKLVYFLFKIGAVKTIIFLSILKNKISSRDK